MVVFLWVLHIVHQENENNFVCEPVMKSARQFHICFLPKPNKIIWSKCSMLVDHLYRRGKSINKLMDELLHVMPQHSFFLWKYRESLVFGKIQLQATLARVSTLRHYNSYFCKGVYVLLTSIVFLANRTELKRSWNQAFTLLYLLAAYLSTLLWALCWGSQSRVLGVFQAD